MADYYPLIAKAVDGLDKSTGEARRALYERARTALVTQLRGVVPALSEQDITRERLALEEAIRKVEAEAARKSRFDPPPERKRADRGEIADPLKPAPLRPAAAPPAAAVAASTAGEEANPSSALSGTAADLRRPVRNPPPERGPIANDGEQDFRKVVADAENLGDATAQAGRAAREVYAAVPSPSPEFDRLEPRLEPEGLRGRDRRQQPRDGGAREEARQAPPNRAPPREGAARTPSARGRDGAARSAGGRAAAPDFDLSPRMDSVRANEFSARDFAPVPDFDAEPNEAHEDFDFDAAPQRQRPRRRAEAVEREETTRRPSLRRERVILLAAGLVLALLVGAVAWEWQPIVGTLRGLIASRPAAPVTETAAPVREKIKDRIGTSESTTENAPNAQNTADVAQRVVLYEEDPQDAGGKRYTGSAVWRTETVTPGAGQPAETVVRADIQIPDRKMTMKWSLRRNTDKSLPASHTVEVVFTLAPDFPHGGVQNVPGVLMKDSEQNRGVPLSGSSVKVMDGYFLIGLSSVDTEMQRNVALLKDRPWFDVPIVYTDGRRAILAVEKGTPGERAFKDAFTAWKQ